jgi:hypothetical protein
MQAKSVRISRTWVLMSTSLDRSTERELVPFCLSLHILSADTARSGGNCSTMTAVRTFSDVANDFGKMRRGPALGREKGFAVSPVRAREMRRFVQERIRESPRPHLANATPATRSRGTESPSTRARRPSIPSIPSRRHPPHWCRTQVSGAASFGWVGQRHGEVPAGALIAAAAGSVGQHQAR